MPLTLSPPDHLPTPRPHPKISPPPKSRLGKFCWRWWIWFSTTLALTVMETWEQVLFYLDSIVTVFGALSILFLTGLLWYLPQHLLVVERRALYYLWGHDSAEQHWWVWLRFRAAQGGKALRKDF